MNNSKEQIPLWMRSMKLVRQADEAPEELLNQLIQFCATFSERTTFRFRGIQRKRFNGTIAEIEKSIQDEQRAMAQGRDNPVVFSTDRHNPLLILSYTQDILNPQYCYDTVEFAFNLSKPLVGLDGYFTFDELVDFFRGCISNYQAETGAIYDSQLLEIVRSKTSREAMMQQLPPEEYQYIPVSPVVEVVSPRLVEPLAQIRHAQTFDITKVPEAIFWINYWNSTQISAIGEELTLSAPWEFVAPHSNGGFILASQKEAFNALKSEHLERLAEIANIINLYAVQEQQY